jgi:hypothetical protein
MDTGLASMKDLPYFVRIATWPGGYTLMRPGTKAGSDAIQKALGRIGEHNMTESWRMLEEGHSRPVALYRDDKLIAYIKYVPSWMTRKFSIDRPRTWNLEQKPLIKADLAVLLSTWVQALDQALDSSASNDLYNDVPQLMTDSSSVGSAGTLANAQRLLKTAPMIQFDYDPSVYRMLEQLPPWTWPQSDFIAWFQAIQG